MKGQIISIDLLVTIVILLIIIGGVGFIVGEFSAFQEQKAKNRDMLIKGQSASSSLTQTPGNPDYWHEFSEED